MSNAIGTAVENKAGGELTPETMPAITYAERLVVTTALLAKLYGTDENNLAKNFQRNADRFVAGKHFHKLEGAELKAFKHCMTNSQAVKIPRQTRNLILWTERGAARHAKMLDTDQAWDVFEKLEDCYFGKTEQEVIPVSKARKPKAQPNGLTLEQQDVIKGMVHDHVEALPMDKRKGAAIRCWSALKSKFGCTYKEIAPEQFTEAVSLVARIELEGEWLPKQKEGDFLISQRDALDICHLLHHAEWCVHRWNQDISKGLMALNQPLWSHTHEHFQEVERTGRGLERSMSEMIGHFRRRLGGLRPGESVGRALAM